MSTKIRIADLSDFDMAEHLPDEQAIAEYLTLVIEGNDPAALAQALGTVARAPGMMNSELIQHIEEDQRWDTGELGRDAAHAKPANLTRQQQDAINATAGQIERAKYEDTP